jgi:hypothetical protein
VNNKSSWARDGLVDFTGELQIRSKSQVDALEEELVVLFQMTTAFVATQLRATEPAMNGGADFARFDARNGSIM